ncbi:unnamed protein product [Ixodes persulcatus]
MGSCVSALSGSRGADRSRRERTFQVWNLDEQGVELSPGKMEVNATDLVLHQRGRPPVRWPLRGLRRYGFDAQLFSFESGRRCPTGSGIYAFRCNRAEGLFNALQECIQNSGAASAMTTTISSAAPGDASQQANGTNGAVAQCDTGFMLPPSATSGPAVDSSGYLEPIALGPPRPPPATLTAPPNPASALLPPAQTAQHSYVNSCTQCGLPHPPPCVDANTNYAKLDELLRQEVRRRDSHFYVNVNPAQGHSYANLSCPASPDRGANNGLAPDEVNYVVLDLDHQSDSSTTGATSPVAAAAAPGGTLAAVGGTASQPTSPVRAPEGYATIDFDRTAALSNSANPGAHQHDDSVRKTRHNSTAVPVLC